MTGEGVSTVSCCMQEVPGRLWEGKESVLDALGALVSAKPAAMASPDAIIGALLGAEVTSCT